MLTSRQKSNGSHHANGWQNHESSTHGMKQPQSKKHPLVKWCERFLAKRDLRKYSRGVKTEAAKRSEAVDPILSRILNWEVCWLAQAENPSPPMIFENGANYKRIKLWYSDPQEYRDTYLPLLMHEIWSQIWADFPRASSNEFRVEPLHGPFMDSSSKLLAGIICQMDEDEPHNDEWPMEGDLVALHVQFAVHASSTFGRKSGVESIFGYITDSPDVPVRDHGNFHDQDTPLVKRYVIQVAKRHFDLLSRPITGMVCAKVYRLRPQLRQIEALVNLPHTKLAQQILVPKLCSWPESYSPQDFTQYNEQQCRAIIGAVNMIRQPLTDTSIGLIQGPPGTGKTRTLVGMVKTLYSNWHMATRPRLLICAPSNGAVDEIARRLLKEASFMEETKWKRSLRIIRVGAVDSIAEDVIQVTPEYLLEERVPSLEEEFAKEKADQISQLKSKLKLIQERIPYMKSWSGTDSIIAKDEEKAQGFIKQIEELENRQLSQWRIYKEKDKIIKDADIILTTLNSSHSAPIERLYNDDGDFTFTACIVDETSQSVETEVSNLIFSHFA